jgi:hypothetical protein
MINRHGVYSKSKLLHAMWCNEEKYPHHQTERNVSKNKSWLIIKIRILNEHKLHRLFKKLNRTE